MKISSNDSRFPACDYRYRFIRLFILAILLIGIMPSCGPRPEVKIVNAPYDLNAVSANQTATITWSMDREDNALFGGYNIYFAESSDSPFQLYNSGPYPGDTDGDNRHESIELNNLTNGIEYLAYIQTLSASGQAIATSDTISFRPLATGELRITQNHSIVGSGYSFAKAKYTKARDFDNDFYIYATEDKAGISSPSRLYSSLRKTAIAIADGAGDQTSQQLTKGKTYNLKLADGGVASVTLTRFIGESPTLEVIFRFTYYPPGLSL